MAGTLDNELYSWGYHKRKGGDADERTQNGRDAEEQQSSSAASSLASSTVSMNTMLTAATSPEGTLPAGRLKGQRAGTMPTATGEAEERTRPRCSSEQRTLLTKTKHKKNGMNAEAEGEAAQAKRKINAENKKRKNNCRNIAQQSFPYVQQQLPRYEVSRTREGQMIRMANDFVPLPELRPRLILRCFCWGERRPPSFRKN